MTLFYEKYKAIYGMEGSLYEENFYQWFSPEISKYNAEFFENKAVVGCLVIASSGFNRYKVSSCQIGIKNMAIHINCYVPSFGTCDIADWLICIELEKKLIENCTNVKVDINTIRES